MELTQEELEKIKKVTLKNWDKLLNKILSVRNGKYPTDWYEKVIATGLIPNGEITISSEYN